MKIWLITDTHFGHDKMVEFCGRDPDFSQIILDNLSKVVKEDSLLIHLGDICIGNDQKWNDALSDALPSVSKILIRGNHDRKSDQWYMSNGWRFVAESIQNTYFGKNILLSHFPLKDNGYDINIHGHFHNSDHQRHETDLLAIKNDKQKLLAIEHTNLMPIRLDNFIIHRNVPKCGIDRDSKDDDCGHLNKVSSLPSKDTKKEGEA